MAKKLGPALYAVVIVATIVTVDILIFQHRFWERLAANIGIVVLFGAFYVLFLKRGRPLA